MDFQDLLDEVEQVIGSSTTKTTTASRSSHPPDESPLTRRKSVDIDDLLSMIDDGDDSPTSAIVHPRSTTTPSVSTKRVDEFTITSGSKKCSTLMLGGEVAKRGVNTAFASHNVCSNLRCNECDFTVVQFLGMKWSSNADYMFFRENVPNEAKLRARMEAAPSSAAYACQCKWLSIDVQTRVDMCRVKWSCAGH